MKRGPLLLPVLWLGASLTGYAFTLDIASNEVTEFGQGPRSIYVPGYGEVVFESNLDGVLVVDSGYASTGEMNVPPAATSVSEVPVAATEDTGHVTIASRAIASESGMNDKSVAGVESDPQAGDSVPETASAALGLLGILLFLLRRWR